MKNFADNFWCFKKGGKGKIFFKTLAYFIQVSITTPPSFHNMQQLYNNSP